MKRFAISASSGLAALLALSLGASAATLTLGNSVGSPNAGDPTIGNVRTDIDLIHPANASGTVDTAAFFWSGVCSNAAKIKFFRRSGDTLTMIAERGPFSSSSGSTTVAIAPPVDVQQGDLVGIARIANCGNAETLTGIPTAGYVAYVGDVTGSVSLTSPDSRAPDVLAVQATGSATESVSRVIPVVVSTGGLFGSFFKTGVQIFNPSPGSSTIAGRFVFHPAGVSGNLSDPSLPISVAAGQTISYTDILATMGQSGVGSMDLVLPDASQAPVVVVRVYNDAGAAGTTGFTEDLIDPSGSFPNAVLFGGVTGFILGPSDTAHFRYNIGVRTLFGGASITATVRNSAGSVLRTTTLNFPPTYLQQVDAATFLGAPLGNDQSIQISVSSGSAIIYGATADNTTNDPSIQFASGVFAVAAEAPPRK